MHYGKDEGEAEAKKQLAQIASDQPIKYSCTLTHGRQDIILACSPDEEFPLANMYSETQKAEADTRIAAEVIRGAGFAGEAVCGSLDIPTKHAPYWRVRSASDQMCTLIPRFAAAGEANGVYLDQHVRLVKHAGRAIDGRISSQEIDDRPWDAAKYISSLHPMASKLNVYEVGMEDTRRTGCVGLNICAACPVFMLSCCVSCTRFAREC